MDSKVDPKVIIALAVAFSLVPMVFFFTMIGGIVAGIAGSVGSAGAGAAAGGAAGICSGDAGDPGGSSVQQVNYPSSGALHDQQIANAKTIDGVAKERGLPGKATLIALMTGLVESSLIDLHGGDRDSLGVFQQRPSAGWGTPAQITDVAFSANTFFGRGGHYPEGLTDKRGWPDRPMGPVAQSVQHSAFPDRYAEREQQARAIAKEAGIDVGRAGDPYAGLNGSHGGQQISGSDDSGSTEQVGDQGCAEGVNTGQDTVGKPGQAFHDRAGSFTAQQLGKNPRTPQQAVDWAKNQVDHPFQNWQGKCLNFVARAYGWAASGAAPNTNAWAYEFYEKSIPQNMHHDKDRHPIPGALLFWNGTGSQYGHVALYIGDGKVASTDILRKGQVDIVPAQVVESKWGANYVGWAPPYFKYAAGTTP